MSVTPFRHTTNMCSIGEAEGGESDGGEEGGGERTATPQFLPAFAGTDESRAAVAAVRELASTIVKGLTDDECFGLFDDV